MTKIVERFKKFVRNLEEEIWKKSCKEFTSFQIYESGYEFTICMMFDEKISTSEKESISNFLEVALTKEKVNIMIALEATRQKFNVGVAAQGANGNKILLFVNKWKKT